MNAAFPCHMNFLLGRVWHLCLSHLPQSCPGKAHQAASVQVGSTGVGALTVAFLILVVSTIVFLAKANGSGEQRKFYYCEFP